MADTAKKSQLATKYRSRLKTLYREEYQPQLKKELSLDNINEVPKLEKVVISVGLGRAKDEKRLLEVATNTLQKIAGQKPLETAAKQSIASFKLREGSKIGLKLTLRGDQMYDFIDRLINLVLPRLRDFRGVSQNSFDKDGNYSLGLVDQSVFPELTFEDTATPHGLQVTFVINCKDAKQSRALLEKFGLPFERPQSGTPGKETK